MDILSFALNGDILKAYKCVRLTKFLTEGGTLEVGKVPGGAGKARAGGSRVSREFRLTWLASRAALGGTTQWFKLGNSNIDLTELY